MTTPTPVRSHDILSDLDLARVVGGAQPSAPDAARQRLLQQCGPQIDAYSAAKKDYSQNPDDTRKQIDAATAGRNLAVCSQNAGFDPIPEWRYFNGGK